MKMKMYPARARLLALNVAVAAMQGGDLFGVSRTVDHAVYTLLNAAAVILWRLNAAIISMSMFGYVTQDWLTNRHDGGVWHVLGMIAPADPLPPPTRPRPVDSLQSFFTAARWLTFSFSRRLLRSQSPWSPDRTAASR